MRDEVFNFLTRPKKTKARIACINEQIENLRSMLYPSGIRYDRDKVQTSPTDAMPEFAAKLDELEREKAELQKRYLEEQERVVSAINGLADSYQAQILSMRYVGCKPFNEIIRAMPFAESTVYLLHQKGLRCIGNYIQGKL